MRLITILKNQFLTKLPSNDIYFKSFVSIVVLSIIAGVLWISGPYLSWGSYAPLVQTEKRIYVIIFLFLVWLLKLLLLDLDVPDPFRYKEPAVRQKLKNLKIRFLGALKFLKKTVISKTEHLQSTRLHTLPWYLLIGPQNAGKTMLLANSNIHFILQKRVQSVPMQEGEQCDWWITRDASIIDIPGKYVCSQEIIKQGQLKLNVYAILWQFFLGLTRYYCGKNGINGIILTIPLPEIIKQNDNKQYRSLLHILFHRIHELQKYFSKQFPCYILITKCDLLAGFAEFFAESGYDEINQAWGITVTESTSQEKAPEFINTKFDALIKKLNQQLLWRLHQERNPMARPYIKEFPLQVERLKEYVLDFIKEMGDAKLPLAVKGVYLTSALQKKAEPENQIIDETENNTEHALQIFKEPVPASRAYFIKQFFSHALTVPSIQQLAPNHPKVWINRAAIVIAVLIIAGSALMLGKDFKQSINQAYMIQDYLAEYQMAIQKDQDPDEHLIITSDLLDTLEMIAKKNQFRLDSPYLLAFYSYKSQQKTMIFYQQVLKVILIPQIKNYFEEYLRNPVNKNTEYVYAVLKAYLMLGDLQFYDADFIRQTIEEILPKAMQRKPSFMSHVKLALNTSFSPVALNPNLVQLTRKYLTAIPSFRLGYIILKNNNHHMGRPIHVGAITAQNAVFINRQVRDEIPSMFTAQTFANILSKETVIAAKEAAYGNWIIGAEANNNPALATTLLEQLRVAYINNYIDIWETFIANIQLVTPKDLTQLDNMIVTLMSNDSPLLQILHTLHENTYFEPITTSSPRLQGLGFLLEKNQDAENLLYQIFTSLQALHQYVQAIQQADNEKKAAFEAVSHRMLAPEKPDALARLWLTAGKSPEPIRNWLNKLANTTWHFLMQDAGKYLDTSWQEQVIRVYQTEIANKYPFNSKANREVSLEKFASFFGKPGVINNFYSKYLQGFIDTSSADWHWKIMNDEKLPFSEDILPQIQQAMQIHQLFFPNDDDKLYVQFALQPYSFGKNIKSVKFTINDKQIIDQKPDNHISHVMAWGAPHAGYKTAYLLTLANKKVISKDFQGDWGWFKLVSQSFDSAVNKKDLLINLSKDNQSAKYLLSTEGAMNPFLSLNWRQLNLPQRLGND